MKNPVVYFEIPVTDLQRAIQFYQTIFGFTFETELMDGNEMAYFPFFEEQSGITGALVKGEIYIPTINGALIYFAVEEMEEILNRAVQQGATVLYPPSVNDQYGFIIAELADSEGNRIGLHQTIR